jgi:hypothetical protein
MSRANNETMELLPFLLILGKQRYLWLFLHSQRRKAKESKSNQIIHTTAFTFTEEMKKRVCPCVEMSPGTT